ARLEIPEKIAGSYKLLGYIFWINATWFLCGETAKMHLKAFQGSSAPSPIEVMVFLVLGWLFMLVGEYKTMQLRQSHVDAHLVASGKPSQDGIPQVGG
ncbi:MAG: hypothetical protein JSV68_03390, partial [Anaerolineaceae bacterium]